MAMDIELFMDSTYCGTADIVRIESLCEEYRRSALSKASAIEWDEIILYAILVYEPKSGSMISADFMFVRMPYSRYEELCSKLSDRCRLFFVGRS